ncbi:MAG: tetratricopeptide repeat protein [Prevotellaceae bacterium]|jgi:superkiller protein 3|nr:tetratricopeptide repeat protein [Prevotellaceae bacterium]
MFWKIIQLIISILLIIGGLSGELVLRFTNSSTLLVIAGFIWLIYDIGAIITHFDKRKNNNVEIDHAKLENYTEAIECWQKAIDINPNDAVAYYNMGNAYDELGNYTEAIACYQKSLDIDPTAARVYNNMGYSYAGLENYTEAISCWQKAVDIDPTDALSYNNMGSAYYKLGNHTEAIDCYKKAAQLGDKNTQILLKENGYSW